MSEKILVVCANCSKRIRTSRRSGILGCPECCEDNEVIISSTGSVTVSIKEASLSGEQLSRAMQNSHKYNKSHLVCICGHYLINSDGTKKPNWKSFQKALEALSIETGSTLFDQTPYTIDDIDTMQGHSFEIFIRDLFQYRMGVETQITKGSSDFGADLIATSSTGQRTAIQCKRWTSGSVGVKEVQATYAAKSFYNCDKAQIICTSNRYTKQARQLASELGVELVSRDNLEKWLATYSANKDASIRPVIRCFHCSQRIRLPMAAEGILKCPKCSAKNTILLTADGIRVDSLSTASNQTAKSNASAPSKKTKNQTSRDTETSIRRNPSPCKRIARVIECFQCNQRLKILTSNSGFISGRVECPSCSAENLVLINDANDEPPSPLERDMDSFVMSEPMHNQEPINPGSIELKCMECSTHLIVTEQKGSRAKGICPNCKCMSDIKFKSNGSTRISTRLQSKDNTYIARVIRRILGKT